MTEVVLSNALNATLLSLQRTSSLIDDVTLRLASGLKVNSALDNPQNFFAASALGNEASDLSRLLDGITQSIRAVEQASTGLENVSKLIDQAETLAQQRIAEIEAIDVHPPIDGESYLSYLITEENEADFYFKLDGQTIDDAGDVGTTGNYTATTVRESDPLFEGSNGSAYFNGINASASIAYNPQLTGNFTEKTIEFVFNAENTSGRQVIYSQGHATRGFDVYIDDGQLYFTAINSPSFGGASAIPQPVFNTEIRAGKTYHAAIVYSLAENRLEAFLDGESLGTSEVGTTQFFGHNAPTIARQSAATKTHHDGATTGQNYFNGYVSDLAIHNDVLSSDDIYQHALAAGANGYDYLSQEYTAVIDQIERLAYDSNYRGLSLLRGSTIHTQFNAKDTSFLNTEGIDITSYAGGLPDGGFDEVEELENIIAELREFRQDVRIFMTSLTSDLNIIQTRKTFTQDLIATLNAGRDDLTLADQNEDGASLLALQTRQTLGVTALSLAAQSTRQTLRLF